MKRKIIAFAVAAALVPAMVLSGCGGGDVAKPYDYDLSKYVKVGEYKGIEIAPVEVAEITEADIENELSSRLYAAQYDEEVLEGTVAKGDKINIDYVGTIDGEEFEGGSTKGQGTAITVGQAGYIAGFEDGLIGANVGDTVVLDLAFPDDYYNADLAGKPCQFTVTINKILKPVIPEFNQEFVTANSEFKTEEEYRQKVKEDLEAAAQENADYQRETALWTKVMENTEVLEYPAEETDAIAANYAEYMDNMMSASGFTKEDYLAAAGQTAEQYDAELRKSAEEYVKNEMALFAIARAEDLEINKKEYDEGIQKMLETQGFASDADFKSVSGKTFEEYMGEEEIVKSVTFEKVLKFLLDNAVEK